MNSERGEKCSKTPLLLLSRTLLNWHIVMWVALPQNPSGLYLFTFSAFHLPAQALESSLISLDGPTRLSRGHYWRYLYPLFFSSAPISRAESVLAAGVELLVRIMKFSSHWQCLCSRVASLCRLFSSRLLLDASGSALFLLQQGHITLW